LCRAIENNPDGPVKLETLAAQIGASPHAVLRAFQKTIGVSPRQYADAVRLRRLKGHLKKGSDVTTALYEAGYGSPSRLYESASSALGMTPGTYLKGGKGMEIAYTIAPCALGRVLVAATRRGVSAVYLGNKDAPLERALQEEYPRAEIRRDSEALGGFVNKIVDHLQGAQRKLDLPIDVEATAFQRRVWEELKKIPYGATRSYSAVARAIGRPKAVRAVARACATNPVSIVVPCHRVVREDGQMAGYRWGMAKKTALLAQERKRSS
jgi:AraC family transcriptional regulator of adaptative response/methylated-DNA-[protein]-cysteine methyltransferase